MPTTLPDLASMYASGMTHAAIGRALGVSTRNASSRLRRAGLTGTRVHGFNMRQVSAATLAAWVAEYAAGDSLETIAARHGRGLTTVHTYMRRHSVVLRPPPRCTWSKQEALALFTRGWTWRAIGSHYGVSGEAVRKTCTRALRLREVRL